MADIYEALIMASVIIALILAIAFAFFLGWGYLSFGLILLFVIAIITLSAFVFLDLYFRRIKPGDCPKKEEGSSFGVISGTSSSSIRKNGCSPSPNCSFFVDNLTDASAKCDQFACNAFLYNPSSGTMSILSDNFKKINSPGTEIYYRL